MHKTPIVASITFSCPNFSFASFAKISINESKPIAGKKIIVSIDGNNLLENSPVDIVVYLYNSDNDLPTIIENPYEPGKITFPSSLSLSKEQCHE